MCFVPTLPAIPEEPRREVRFSCFDVVAKATRTGIQICGHIPTGACPFTSSEMEQKALNNVMKKHKEVARAAAQLVWLWLQENPKAKKDLLSSLCRDPGMVFYHEKMVKVFFFDAHCQGIKWFIRSAVNENRDLYLPKFKGVDCERSLLTEFFGALVLYAKRTSPYYETAVVRVQSLVRGWIVRRRLAREKTWNLLLTDGL